MNRIPINIVFGTLHKVIRTKDREEAVSTLQTLCEEFVSSNADCHEFGLFAFQSYTRAYTTHAQSTKDIFNVHNLHLGTPCDPFFVCALPLGSLRGEKMVNLCPSIPLA